MKQGYIQCNWELKHCNQKPIFVWSLRPFWIGYNFALLIDKIDQHF